MFANLRANIFYLNNVKMGFGLGLFANSLNLEDRKINISGAMCTMALMMIPGHVFFGWKGKDVEIPPLARKYQIMYLAFIAASYIAGSSLSNYTNRNTKRLYRKYKEWRGKTVEK